MKALTVKDPWAWSIATGEKRIENRSPGAVYWQPCNDLVIHAGASWSWRGGGDVRVRRAWARAQGLGLVGNLTPLSAGMRRSSFVAVVDLVDVHTESGCCAPWGEASYEDATGHVIKHVTHLVFENIRRIDPVPWRRGWLGLWTIPTDGERLVRAALAA